MVGKKIEVSARGKIENLPKKEVLLRRKISFDVLFPEKRDPWMIYMVFGEILVQVIDKQLPPSLN